MADQVFSEIQALVRKRCREADKIAGLLQDHKDVFLSKQRDINSGLGAGKSTLLHSASWFISDKVVKALLEVKADPDATNIKGNSPLHLACQKLPESKAVVEMLVQAGGNRYLEAADGSTPEKKVPSDLQGWFKDLRALNAEEEKSKPGKRRGRSRSPVRMKAEAEKAFQAVQALIAKGKCREEAKILALLEEKGKLFSDDSTSINTPIGRGKSTLLHSAVWFKNLPVIDKLLAIKADPNAQNIKGNSPLHLACEKLPETKDVVSRLVAKGGNRYNSTVAGKTAMGSAPSSLKKWMLDLKPLSPAEEEAKAHAASRKAVNADQANLLDPAKQKLAKDIYEQLSTLIVKKKCRDEKEIVSMLDKYKELFCGSVRYVSIDSPASYGITTSSSNSTFLHSAVWYQKIDVVKKLLLCLASPNAQNVKGNSPLLLACEKLPEGKDIVETLVLNENFMTKGNRHLASSDGKTPLKCVPANMRKWFINLRPLDRDEKIAKSKNERSRSNSRPRSARTDMKLKRADEVFDTLTKLVLKKRCREEDKIVKLMVDNADLFGDSSTVKDINTPIGASNSTLLHSAAWFLNTSVVSQLLTLKADPNVANVKMNTALHLACEKLPESKRIVELMVSSNGNRFRKSLSGKCAASIVPSELKDWLLGLRPLTQSEKDAKVGKLSDDMRSGRRASQRTPGLDPKMKLARKILEELSQHIISKKCRDAHEILDLLKKNKSLFTGNNEDLRLDTLARNSSSSNSTLLHSAVWYMKLDVVSALVQSGASANAQNIKGNSALHLACEKLPESKKIVEFLVTKGAANRCLGNSAMKSPIECAESKELRDWIIDLQDYTKDELAAERERRNAKKRPSSSLRYERKLKEERRLTKLEKNRIAITDLVAKKYCKDTEQIISLLDSSRFPQDMLDLPVNTSKQTLLHVAAKLASTVVVSALIKAKASLDIVDIRQNSALHLACDKLPKSKAAVSELIIAGANRYLLNSQKQTPSSYVPARLRGWFMRVAPVTQEEKKLLESRFQKSFKKGLDVALIRHRMEQLDKQRTGTLTEEEVLMCLTDGGMDKELAEKNVKDFLRQHKDQSDDAILWKVFLNEFVRMKLFHCVVMLGQAKIFGKVDTDHSASVGLREFTVHLESQIGREEAHKQSRKLFSKIDANHDGNISKFELRMWYRERLKALRKRVTAKK